MTPRKPVYLKAGGQYLALSSGSYVIGRSPLCNLVIEGPLVSRQHAELKVAEETAILKDLDSVNGVLINGQRVFGSRVLKPGDRIKIGHRELEFTGTEMSHRGTNIELSEKSRGHRSPLSRDRALDDEAAIDSGDSTRQAGALELVGQVAARALEEGRVLEAERLLDNHLKRILVACQAGRSDKETVELAAELAFKLAERSGSGTWVGFLLQLMRATNAICTEAVAERLRAILSRTAAADADQLESYARGMRASFPYNLEQLASARRLEELARLVRERGLPRHSVSP